MGLVFVGEEAFWSWLVCGSEQASFSVGEQASLRNLSIV